MVLLALDLEALRSEWIIDDDAFGWAWAWSGCIRVLRAREVLGAIDESGWGLWDRDRVNLVTTEADSSLGSAFSFLELPVVCTVPLFPMDVRIQEECQAGRVIEFPTNDMWSMKGSMNADIVPHVGVISFQYAFHSWRLLYFVFDWQKGILFEREGAKSQGSLSRRSSWASLTRFPAILSVKVSLSTPHSFPRRTWRNSRRCCRCHKVWIPQSKALGWKWTLYCLSKTNLCHKSKHTPCCEDRRPNQFEGYCLNKQLLLSTAPKFQWATLGPKVDWCQWSSITYRTESLLASNLYFSGEGQVFDGWQRRSHGGYRRFQCAWSENRWRQNTNGTSFREWGWRPSPNRKGQVRGLATIK